MNFDQIKKKYYNEIFTLINMTKTHASYEKRIDDNVVVRVECTPPDAYKLNNEESLFSLDSQAEIQFIDVKETYVL